MSDATAILFTADHVIAFLQMKATLYDCGTGVALIFKIPHKAPKVSDTLVLTFMSSSLYAAFWRSRTRSVARKESAADN